MAAAEEARDRAADFRAHWRELHHHDSLEDALAHFKLNLNRVTLAADLAFTFGRERIGCILLLQQSRGPAYCPGHPKAARRTRYTVQRIAVQFPRRGTGMALMRRLIELLGQVHLQSAISPGGRALGARLVREGVMRPDPYTEDTYYACACA